MVEALMLSVDEPQLDRAMEALENQTVKFSNIIHINGISPHSVAYNHGLSLVKDKWFMLIAGDVILNHNGLEMAMEYINSWEDPKIHSYCFPLTDTFLESGLWGVGFSNTKIHQNIPILDKLCNDRILGKALDAEGYYRVKVKKLIGTHFDKPDEFQVFRRFFILGRKFRGSYPEDLKNRLVSLYEKSNNPLYQLAMKAIDFAKVNGRYPGSHNIEYDGKKYEEFKKWV